MSNLLLTAPMRGWVAPLDEVPDPVFSERILGNGLAIDPTGSAIYAPCDGVIASVAAHAVTVRADSGAEILIHLGLETVALGGQGFMPHVREGKTVHTGELLISFDLDFLATRAKSLISPIILINGDAFEVVRSSLNREAARGDFLMEIRRRNGHATAHSVSTTRAEREILVGFPHGLHARPAALLANAAKAFAASVSISCGGRAANAKSVAALMALGARQGDRVTISAEGEGADAAVGALASLLEGTAAQSASRSAARAEPVRILPSSRNEFRGLCASLGLAIGPVHHLRTAEIAVVESGNGISAETAALTGAIAAVRSRLAADAEKGSGAHREILAAHIALLDDSELRRSALKQIEAGKSAGFAWRSALRETISALEHLDDPLMRERAKDILDLERQVLVALSGEKAAPVSVPDGAIVIAEDLLPSQFVALGTRMAGICTAAGGPTSHVAILATGLGVPMLVGAGKAVLATPDRATAILDADAGVLRLNADEQTLAQVRARLKHRQGLREEAFALARDEGRTAEGIRIHVFANLGAGAEEAAAAVQQGAEGCGLLRTEFLFVDRTTPPSEDEQAAQYETILRALDGRPLTIRTLDIGGDKPVPFLPLPREDNPALGLRGIRASLAWPDLLRIQLAAIVRAAQHGPCRILLPLITSVSEIHAVRALLDGIRGADNVKLGAMIETPAAAMIAKEIARETDFLSIGSNDLTQYALARDRTNPQVSAQVDALHPAVLRLIAKTVEDAGEKPVCVCGGLAADLLGAPILIGLGIRELSVPPATIPLLKSALRALSTEQMRALAQSALRQYSPEAVRELAGNALSGVLP